MGPNKAPGSDGYNAYVYQQNWDIIGPSIIEAAQSFYTSGCLVKEWNHTFLCLVHVSLIAEGLADYRLISCCNVLYKVISKVLCNWLQLVISKLIFPNQAAFLKWSLISDCTFLSHELVLDFNKPIGKNVLESKVFDTVNIEFMYYIVHLMGFPRCWIHCINECIFSPSFSVLFDGSSTCFFTSNMGIRLWDPLSPYLFVLVTETFSILLDRVVAERSVRPLKRLPFYLSHTYNLLMISWFFTALTVIPQSTWILCLIY